MKNLILASILLLTSTFVNGQKYSKYFKSMSYGETILIDEILDVNVAVIPIPDEAPKVEELKTFFDLRDSIPHVFIKAITSLSTSTSQVTDAMKSPLSLPKIKDISRPKFFDKTDIKVKLIFSNVKKYYGRDNFYHPNNRLEILNTKVKFDDSVSIKNIDRLENETDFIDFGILERNNKITFGANLTGNLGFNNSWESTSYDSSEYSNPSGGNGLVGSNQISTSKQGSNSKNTRSSGYGVNGGLNYAYENAVKENLTVKLKRLKTGFSINSKEFTLSQHGVPLNDVHDNAYVTLTLTLEGKNKFDNLTHFDNLFNITGNPNPLKDVLITNQGFNYYPCNAISDLSFSFEAEGLFRQVKKGRGFFENDDKVEYRKLKPSSKEYDIKINKYEFCEDLYMVVIKEGTTIHKLSIENESRRFCYLRNDISSVKILKWIEEAVKSNDHTFFTSNYKLRFSIGNPEIGLKFEDAADLSKIKTLINNHGLGVVKL